MSGLIGTKCGTTRLFTEDGSVEQVTIIKVDDNFVTAVKQQAVHGYSAIQLASIPVSKNVNKPSQGHFEAAKVPAQKVLKEFKSEGNETVNLGDKLGVELFEDTFGDTHNVAYFKRERKRIGHINLWLESKCYNHIEMVHHTWLLSIVDYVSKSKF